MKSYRNFFYIFFLFLFCSTIGFAQKTKNKAPSKYEFQGPFCDGLAKVRLNKKWGFIDSTGGVVVSPKYNEVGNFSDGLARVRKGQKWGLIDTSGKEIIRPMFDWIYDFENGKAKVKSDGAEGYIDRYGNLVQ